MVTRVSDRQAATTTADEPVHALRCPNCDVTWRGISSVPCWCCGALGDRRGDVRIISD